MFDKIIGRRISVQIDDKGQWNELKNFCTENKIRLVRYNENEFIYPIQCLLIKIEATGQALLCPSEDDKNECINRGWEIVNFELFKDFA